MAGEDEKWTPGPWEVSSAFVGPLQVGTDDTLFAEVGHEDFAVCRANAHLIAAAPELYRDLLRLTRADVMAPDYAHAQVAARLTLAKARAAQ